MAAAYQCDACGCLFEGDPARKLGKKITLEKGAWRKFRPGDYSRNFTVVCIYVIVREIDDPDGEDSPELCPTCLWKAVEVALTSAKKEDVIEVDEDGDELDEEGTDG